MPAFDPVRDAVLNSPITPSQPLSPYSRIDTDSSPTVSPLLHNRRATDLSVLLNSDSHQPPLRIPPPSRTSTLSRLLLHTHPDDNKLATASPLQNRAHLSLQHPPQPHSSSPRDFLLNPAIPPARPRLPAPSSNPPLPLPPPVDHPSPRSSSSPSETSEHLPVTPSTTESPSMPPPPPPPTPMSTIPYNPHRITPAGSVLIPLSQAEMEKYRNYRGIATQRLAKRKRSSDDPDHIAQPPLKKMTGDVGVVVEHYNARPDVGVVQRLESPIIGLKNFNNWVKSVLITRFAHPVLAAGTSSTHPNRGRGSKPGSGKVLDMGCGKGGDITKWARARVKDFFAVDIAAVSVEHARSRWEGFRPPPFNANFATLDCYSESLSKAFSPAKLAQPFDVVSMQFCMHYAFESLQKARCMLENVSRWLRPGGVFIGTIPNAEQLLERLDGLPPDADELSFGNSVYKIRFEERAKKPVFGHKYWFYLQDAVENVPEYVVRWEPFVQMAAEFKLFPMYKQEFHQVFEEHQNHPEFGPLMLRMKVKDANGESAMDEDQWEAANIYIAFAFEKR